MQDTKKLHKLFIDVALTLNVILTFNVQNRLNRLNAEIYRG